METNKDIQEHAQAALSDEQIIEALMPHIDSYPSTKAGEVSFWMTQPELIAFVRAILATRQPTPVASAPAVAVPVDADALRAAGRAEALAILMRLDPEVGIEDYTGWGNSGAPEDEGSAFWKEDKLRELFMVDGSLADMMDKAEGEYWHYKGLQMEAEHAKNFAANMHNSGKVRDVLAKAGEHDLMADLCRTPQPAAAPVAAAVPLRRFNWTQQGMEQAADGAYCYASEAHQGEKGT